MKQWIALAVIAPTLLLGAEKETCPFGPFDLRSPREQQVMEMLSRGMTNREIAEHLDISIKTVDERSDRGAHGRRVAADAGQRAGQATAP